MTLVVVRKYFRKLDSFDKGLCLFLILGAVISTTSLFRGILRGSQVQIEYLESGSEANQGKQKGIYVDVEGAVISPGVYQLTEGSRIKDVLVLAGGLAEKADRSYTEKNLNLAQLLKDGQKIYVPEKSNTPLEVGYTEAKTGSKEINVNTASASELDTLWGVGPARAESIVKNRPYGSLEELVSKGGMTKAILEKNREVLKLY